MLTTPVALIAFNRPQVVRRTLAAVAAAEPRQLFVITDGPRATHPEDEANCAATREVLAAIDWPCEVVRRQAPENLGLEANVELGLDWLFSQVDEAIVLEDDCVAHRSFFDYAALLLDRYRDDQRVWQVSGSGLGVPAALFGGDSYAFTAWASVWGWATWADRWQQHRREFPRDHVDGDLPVRTEPVQLGRAQLATRSGQRHFTEAAASTDTVTHGWDKHWWLTMMNRGAMAVSPSVNLVENVGWGPDATHGVTTGRRDHPAQPISFPLRHPDRVEVNREVERELELVLNRVGGRGARLARRVVRWPALRRTARSAVNSRAWTSTARMTSRLTSRSHRG